MRAVQSFQGKDQKATDFRADFPPRTVWHYHDENDSPENNQTDLQKG